MTAIDYDHVYNCIPTLGLKGVSHGDLVAKAALQLNTAEIDFLRSVWASGTKDLKHELFTFMTSSNDMIETHELLSDWFEGEYVGMTMELEDVFDEHISDYVITSKHATQLIAMQNLFETLLDIGSVRLRMDRIASMYLSFVPNPEETAS
jgi:hypothetical protein